MKQQLVHFTIAIIYTFCLVTLGCADHEVPQIQSGNGFISSPIASRFQSSSQDEEEDEKPVPSVLTDSRSFFRGIGIRSSPGNSSGRAIRSINDRGIKTRNLRP